ncbi:MAG TPA: rhodanese-like domain-containing protein [Candidatus Latescibacteria bacterium]|nr:rhodanese-like domain-containing protein [Candidatus Latescibacterota bacterium]
MPNLSCLTVEPVGKPSGPMKIVVGLVLSVVAGCSLSFEADDWPMVKEGIRQRFPQVRQISTAQLASWLAHSDTLQPLLFDVRATQEYAISHLRGARQMSPVQDEALLNEPLQDDPLAGGIALDRPIVLYCSVGYRSARMAEMLQERGYTNVVNLEGSLFTWANESRPLVDAQGRSTTLVHPYDEACSGLLDPPFRSSE